MSHRRADARRQMRRAESPKGPGLMSWWVALATGVVVVGALVVLTIVHGQPHKKAPPVVAAPKISAYKSQGHAIVPLTKMAGYKYNSTPPTSGPHAQALPESWKGAWPAGAKGTAQLLSVLEKANVVIAYATEGVAKSEVTDLDNLTGPYRTGSVAKAVAKGQAVFVVPWAGLPKGEVAALAWRHRLEAKSPSGSDLVDFITQYVGDTKNATS